jgi:hypothetical protein
MEVLDVPAAVPTLILFGQRHDFIDRGSVMTHLFQAPVDQPIQPIVFVANQITPETAFAYAQ